MMSKRNHLRSVDSKNGEDFDTLALADGGEPPDDGGMRERVAKIEATLASLATKADVEALRSDLRTDFRDVSNDVKKWTLTTSWTVIAVGVIGLFGLLFTIYNANKLAAKETEKPAATLAPIIIQMPTPAAPAPAPVPEPAPPQADRP
ncbi:hypothetical protein [Stenotrophomonas maltophilia]|uniref:hypothetical protein n=1 Tax=Stenotrophomonas maltophilia TaxID=40324 RepID=UPI0015F2373B|nr:hypothetical protein [Stenotrophomonas maltophilia]QDY50440.1 hypothetical protein DUW70_18915 [Stenotrophomonas maltophilia]